MEVYREKKRLFAADWPRCTVAGVCYAGTNYTVETVQFPGDTFTQLLGINNTDTIAGFHGAAVAEG